MRSAAYLFWFLISLSSAKIYEKCELASELKTKYGMSLEEVKNWVCIAEFESTFNTEAINPTNWDGSKDFGLFQINNRYWCGDEFGKSECGVPCERFLDDDIEDDLKCAKKIVKDTERWTKKPNGLVAWVAYVRKCQTQDLGTYIKECLDVLETRPTEETKEPSEAVTTAPQVETTKPPRGSGLGFLTGPVRQESSKPSVNLSPAVPLETRPLDQTGSEQVELTKPPRGSGLGFLTGPTHQESPEPSVNSSPAVPLQTRPFYQSGDQKVELPKPLLASVLGFLSEPVRQESPEPSLNSSPAAMFPSQPLVQPESQEDQNGSSIQYDLTASSYGNFISTFPNFANVLGGYKPHMAILFLAALSNVNFLKSPQGQRPDSIKPMIQYNLPPSYASILSTAPGHVIYPDLKSQVIPLKLSIPGTTNSPSLRPVSLPYFQDQLVRIPTYAGRPISPHPLVEPTLRGDPKLNLGPFGINNRIPTSAVLYPFLAPPFQNAYTLPQNPIPGRLPF